ncbi:Bacterial Ig-like domain (group 2) [Anatilimnocola aggregata]|uniref:Bacterial Ig-like domain (Group 2) n=1 Tax=Anatilimnocola aggregata TaxID=2528021 RepID=A0A517YCK2_9BACT|nr:DUF1549 domain-containing protein [Anatilimnocola aggregata]QDU27951.1 Bacterial Ig-like domain (group 2) [Anatilimnocola aggregata]
MRLALPNLRSWLRMTAPALAFFAVTAGLCQHLAAAEKITVTPATAELDQPEASLQLLVSQPTADKRIIDLTRVAKYRSEDEKIARVDELGLITPVTDGQTNVIVEHPDGTTKVPVTIKGIKDPTHLSFPRDIIPILTKATCNMGGCHGKAEGQNGFKLTVFGFDPKADHDAITKEGRGRRISLASPEHSLLLRKALANEPHGGGQRFEEGSIRHRRLARWISEGATYGSEEAPTLVRIEVEPTEQVLHAKGTQQLRVWAIDSDGSRRCVTTEAEYESNAGVIAGVDGRGFVQASELAGEAAILARYLGQVTVCRITIPQPGVTFTRPPENNFIDRLAWDKLQRLGIEPSEMCDDATFLRRAFLDVIGVLPTAAEAKAFLADPAPNKRSLLVDRLLDRPEYADYWTMRFSDLLRVDQSKITPQGAVAITRWLQRQFVENRPYDQFVRELITAKGNVKAEGPAAFYKALDTPEIAARNVSQVFLGIRLECAQCHHHPSDRWGQEDYFAMAGMFSGVSRKKTPDGGEAIVPIVAKDLKHPRTNEFVQARPLGVTPKPRKAPEPEPVPEPVVVKGKARPAPKPKKGFVPDTAVNEAADPRVELVDWMTAPDNQYFSTMMANRLWAHYFGRGLVEPIDDLRITNPASNEPLLLELSKHLRDCKYDLKAFTRTLLNSRLYQLATTTTPSNATDEQNFSHAAHKALPAEVLLDAIGQATGTPEVFNGWPEGHRAVQIWDNKLPSYFFRIFGRPVRATVCECERSNEPSISQALHLMNSPEIMTKIRNRSGNAATVAKQPLSAADTLDQLYLTVLARYPKPGEKEQLLPILVESPDEGPARREACEDIVWVLLNSKEFLFNH